MAYTLYRLQAFTATLLLMLAAAPVRANDWPNLRGPSHDGASTESQWLKQWPEAGPPIAWQRSVATGYSSVAVVGDRLYTMGHESTDKKNGTDIVWCLDATTGEPLWDFKYPCLTWAIQHEGGPGCTPTVHDGRVYTLSRSGDVHCLDAASGKPLWSRQVERELGLKPPWYGYTGSGVVEGPWIVWDLGPVVAFDRATGELAWRSRPYAPSYSTPVPLTLDGRRALAAFNGDALVVVNAGDGAERMRFPWVTPNIINVMSPLVEQSDARSRIFISSAYERGCARVEVNETTAPTVLWENKKMRNKCSSSVAWQGFVYGFDEAMLRCVDLATGETKWNASGMGLGMGTVALADGHLIVLGQNGQLVVAPASPEGFKPTGRRAELLDGVCWTVPVLSGGRIYCRNNEGDMACVDVRLNYAVGK